MTDLYPPAVTHLPHACGCPWPTPTYDDDGVERCSGCKAEVTT